MEAIVFVILQIFFTAHASLKITLQTEISRGSTDHNPLAYMMYIILFNTELAMHNRAIFKYGRVVNGETSLLCFGPYFLCQKQNRTRLAVVFCLIYCVNDFLTNFMRRLKSLEWKLHVWVPFRLLEKTLVAYTRNLSASGDRAPIRQELCMWIQQSFVEK